MPINRIVATKRGKAAIAAAVAAATALGWHGYKTATATPPAVILATNTLIKPWEGLRLIAYQDSVGIWTVCYGETRIDGKPVRAGMTFTKAQCEAMLETRVYGDYYVPLTKRIAGFTAFPVSVQAAQISGAYNFGVAGMSSSTAARLASQGRYREACEAQTAWNKAGGQIVTGLVRRREMGDAQRIGEAETCVSGLQ